MTEPRVAIVTGAGQGVGRGCALALADAGVRVAVVGRTLSKCEAVVAEIEGRGRDGLADRCDVEQRSDIEATIAKVIERWGRLDIVVNNAQTKVYDSIRRMKESDLESMWQSGPMATFRFMQAAFPHLRDTKGCVVNMGSGSSILPQGAMSGYAMTKEAVRVLTRVAAIEWGRFGIRVNAVCPLANSPGFDEFNAAAPGALERDVLPNIPLGYMGEPEADVGRAVAFLCSEAAQYITGTTLMVDGGFNYLR